jgi:hypothetical protein
MALARPNKSVGRVVLGPRLVGAALVRIVARADGSGQIQHYDRSNASWCDAADLWSFSDIWSAPAGAIGITGG